MREAALPIQPFLILLRAKDSKEDVIEGLGKGANDFLSKPFHEGELRARLAVGQWVIELQTTLADRVKALEEAASHIKTLQGILPICMYCHKIRDDQETWTRLEEYITEHTDVSLSHGLCPECRPRFLK